MDEKGFTFDVIKEIFSKEADKLVGKYATDSGDKDIFVEIHQSPLDSSNGDIDTYLYSPLESNIPVNPQYQSLASLLASCLACPLASPSGRS